jgi:chemotaxis protein histidine kinase CheA
MADTPSTTTPTPKSAPAKRAQARRKTAATDRSTAAKKAAATRARNQAAEASKRSTAAKKAAATRREVERTPVERYVDYADRAVSIQVGAALAVRDSVASTVGELATKYSSLDKVERELRTRRRRVETDLRKLERRGTTARNRFEREVRARRQRVERDLRGVGRDAGAQAGLVGSQVENLVQTGVTAGTQTAAKLTERVARVV